MYHIWSFCVLRKKYQKSNSSYYDKVIEIEQDDNGTVVNFSEQSYKFSFKKLSVPIVRALAQLGVSFF